MIFCVSSSVADAVIIPDAISSSSQVISTRYCITSITAGSRSSKPYSSESCNFDMILSSVHFDWSNFQLNTFEQRWIMSIHSIFTNICRILGCLETAQHDEITWKMPFPIIRSHTWSISNRMISRSFQMSYFKITVSSSSSNIGTSDVLGIGVNGALPESCCSVESSRRFLTSDSHGLKIIG